MLDIYSWNPLSSNSGVRILVLQSQPCYPRAEKVAAIPAEYFPYMWNPQREIQATVSQLPNTQLSHHGCKRLVPESYARLGASDSLGFSKSLWYYHTTTSLIVALDLFSTSAPLRFFHVTVILLEIPETRVLSCSMLD